MKKQTFLFLGLIIIFLTTTFMIYPGGSPGGYTGSPADVNNCTSCHGGSVTTVQNWISSDIPTQGYTPGNTYHISVTGTGSGNKGFELTAEDGSNNKTGTFAAGSGSQLTNSNQAVTQTSAISDNPHTWTLSWTAPQAGTGNVTFYAAVVVGVSNINLTSLQVSENTSSDVLVLNEADIKIKPNPVKGIIKIKSENLIGKSFRIYSVSGSLIYKGMFSGNITSVDISGLEKGIYLFVIGSGRNSVTKKIVKN